MTKLGRACAAYFGTTQPASGRPTSLETAALARTIGSASKPRSDLEPERIPSGPRATRPRAYLVPPVRSHFASLRSRRPSPIPRPMKLAGPSLSCSLQSSRPRRFDYVRLSRPKMATQLQIFEPLPVVTRSTSRMLHLLATSMSLFLIVALSSAPAQAQLAGALAPVARLASALEELEAAREWRIAREALDDCRSGGGDCAGLQARLQHGLSMTFLSELVDGLADVLSGVAATENLVDGAIQSRARSCDAQRKTRPPRFGWAGHRGCR